MSMKTIHLFVLAVVLLPSLILTSPAAFAQMAPPAGRGPNPGQGMSLTPQQRAKLETIQRRFNQEIAPLQGTLYARQLELRALWADPRTSPAVLEAKEKEALEIVRQIQEKSLRYRLEARSLLEPGQIPALQGGYWLFRGLGLGMGYGPGYGTGGGPGRRGRGAGRGPNRFLEERQWDSMGPPPE